MFGIAISCILGDNVNVIFYIDNQTEFRSTKSYLLLGLACDVSLVHAWRGAVINYRERYSKTVLFSTPFDM